MSKMAELSMEINDALDTFVGPDNWKSCQEIADLIGCPVEFVNQIVEDRWEESMNEEMQRQYEMMSYDADASYYGEQY
jgi:hypothetical protein